MSDNSRIAKNTLFLYIRTFITMLVALYTSRVVLNALGIEDFGIWGVLGGIVSMFSFINTSLSSSVFRFVAHAIGSGNNSQVSKVYSASIIAHLCLALIIFLLCETIGQWFLTEKLVVPDAKREISEFVFHIVVLTSCVGLLNVPFNSVIIAYERMNVYAYMAIVDVFIKLFIAYVVYIVPSYKLLWYAVMMFLSSILMLLFYGIYVHRNFSNLKIQRVQDAKLFKSLLGFSGWSLMGNLAYVGYSQGLNMLLNIFFGPVVNAARAISLQIEQTVRTFIGNFQTALNPQIIKNYAANEKFLMYQLIMRGSKFSLYLLFLFALPIMLETDILLMLWLKQVPEYTSTFCRIMFLVIALETITNSVGVGIVATAKIKWLHIIVGTILLTIVPISYVVLQMGAPPESVFVVYLVVEILAVLARLIIANRQIGLSIYLFVKKAMVRPLIVITIASIIPMLIHFYCMPGVMRLLLVLTIGLVISCIAIYYLGLDSNEKKFVQEKVISRIIKK